MNETSDVKKEYSFLCKPGHAIIDHINKNFVEGREHELPTILMTAFMSNTYFYTRMVEMCQYRQVKTENNNLKLCAQIIYQCAKKGIQRRWKGSNLKSQFYVRDERTFKTLFSCVLMPVQKFKELMILKANFKAPKK